MTKNQLETGPSKTHKLGLGAPEFVPFLSLKVLMKNRSLQGEDKLWQKHPLLMDTSWDAYKLQFEILATANGWSSAEKTTYLAVNLKSCPYNAKQHLP